jgi:hypothetical protein
LSLNALFEPEVDGRGALGAAAGVFEAIVLAINASELGLSRLAEQLRSGSRE